MKRSIISGLIVLFCVISIQSTAQWTVIASFNHTISDLKTFDNKLFICGGFTQVDNQTCYWSATYNGTSVSRETDMIGGTGLDDMEVYNNELYAVGALNIASYMGIYKWSGYRWENAAYYNKNYNWIFTDGMDLYASSSFGDVNKKSGSGSFAQVQPFSDGGIPTECVIFNGSPVFAGGFKEHNGTTLNRIARWDGSTWQPLGSGVDGPIYCMAVYKNELYVAGKFENAGGVSAKNIAKWNGSKWTDVGGSLPDYSYNGIRDMIVYNNQLFVGGDFLKIGNIDSKYLASWDGYHWLSQSLDQGNTFVNCMEIYKNRLYIGTFDFSDAKLYSYLPSGIDEEELNPISVYPNPIISSGLTVEFEETINGNMKVELYNLLGALTYENNFMIHSNQVKIENLPVLPNGVYVLAITSDNKKLVRKVEIRN